MNVKKSPFTNKQVLLLAVLIPVVALAIDGIAFKVNANLAAKTNAVDVTAHISR